MLTLENRIKGLQHELASYKRLAEVNESIIRMMYMWLNNPSEEKIEEIFLEMHLERIAIYGYSRLGRILLKQLSGTQIDVSYVIDRNNNLKLLNKNVIHPDEEMPIVDAIIVSNVYDFDAIKTCIEERTKNIPIISLADILCML